MQLKGAGVERTFEEMGGTQIVLVTFNNVLFMFRNEF